MDEQTLAEKYWQSSKSTRWMTPEPVFKALDEKFRFVVDLAAEAVSAKCSIYITEEVNALTEDWSDWAKEGEYGFLNPPYGRPTKLNPGVRAFVKKAYEESQRTGLNVVVLVNAKTDTEWWHTYCWKADEIWEIEGRISFIDPDTGKPGMSGTTCGQAIIIFRRDRQYPECDGPRRAHVDQFMKELTGHRTREKR